MRDWDALVGCMGWVHGLGSVDISHTFYLETKVYPMREMKRSMNAARLALLIQVDSDTLASNIAKAFPQRHHLCKCGYLKMSVCPHQDSFAFTVSIAQSG